MATDVQMTNIGIAKDPATYDANHEFTNAGETVVSNKDKINLGVDISGTGVKNMNPLFFVETATGTIHKVGGVATGPKFVVEYYAESFGPGSNDVLLGTKEGFLVRPTATTSGTEKLSQEDTTAQINLQSVTVGGVAAKPIDPSVYKLTAVVKWFSDDAPTSIPGHAAFIELLGAFEVF